MFYKAAAEQVSQFTQRRQERKPACVPKPLDLTKYGTRKLYIDTMPQDAGWTEGLAERVPRGGDAQRLWHGLCELRPSGRRRPTPSPGGGQAHLPGPGGGPPAGQAVRQPAGAEVRSPAGDLPDQRLRYPHLESQTSAPSPASTPSRTWRRSLTS